MTEIIELDFLNFFIKNFICFAKILSEIYNDLCLTKNLLRNLNLGLEL